MPEQIRQRIHDCLQQAGRHYGRSFPLPEFQLKLRGQAAGKAWPQSNRLAFNALLYQQNQTLFLRQTVAHEVAHLLAWQLYGPAIRPHGKEWQTIMRQVFGLPAERCHHYRLPPQLKTFYDYDCGCPQRRHALSAWRHGRISNGARYHCRSCDSGLTYSGHSHKQLVER